MQIFTIRSIHPTVFMKKEAGGLVQIVDLVIENNHQPATAEVIVHGPMGEQGFPLGMLHPGDNAAQITVAELRHQALVDFLLIVNGSVQDQKTIQWRPPRHWSVYLVQGSHHDLGYTDLPSNLLREHDTFLDDAVRFCEETADWPEDARFHYTVEQAWSVLHYMEHRPADQVQSLISWIRAGNIEVTALLGNETSELCGAEEQIRLLYPAHRLRQRTGIPICSAELNDIPGISWGLASVLAGAGVRYFAPAIPDYYAWGMKIHPLWNEEAVLPRDRNGAFWWEGPDGQRVLFWHEGGAIGWSSLWNLAHAENELLNRLACLELNGYPHDLLRIRVQSGQRDNSPLSLRFSQITRDWNEKWAFPRLIVANNTQFFEHFEQVAGAQLKVLRGELPNTDYAIGAASSGRETGINRRAHDELLAAEKLATWATLLSDYAYPADTLAEAYECALLYDEHTWGMAHPIGPAQEACWSQKSQFAYRAAALAQDVISKSSNRLADEIHLGQEDYHIVVFNPLVQERTDIVRVPGLPPAACGKPMHWQAPPGGSDTPSTLICTTAIGRDLVNLPIDLLEKPFDLLDLDSGEMVEFQVLTLNDPMAARPFAAHNYALGHVDPASLEVLNYGASHLKEIVFTARGIPSLGYKTYRLMPKNGEGINPQNSLRVGAFSLENRFYKIQLDPQNGCIVSIYDKELKREWVDTFSEYGFNQLVVRWPQTGLTKHAENVQISIGESGPVFASLVVKGSVSGCPQITQEIILYHDIKRIDFANRMLHDATPLIEVYFAFPLAVEQPHFRYEASNAIIEPIRDQLPGSNTDAYTVQHWVTVCGARESAIWSSLDAPVAAFSELWPISMSQAHHAATPPDYGREFLHDPEEFKKGGLYSYAMVSNFRTNFQPVQVADALFRYSLTTQTGSANPEEGRDFGWGVCSPLVPVTIQGPQAGTLPISSCFCTVEPSNVFLVNCKGAEDGDGIILRLTESCGKNSQAVIHLPFIKLTQALQTNLVEEGSQELECDEHNLQVEVPANSTVTVRCRCGRKLPTTSTFFYN